MSKSGDDFRTLLTRTVPNNLHRNLQWTRNQKVIMELVCLKVRS